MQISHILISKKLETTYFKIFKFLFFILKFFTFKKFLKKFWMIFLYAEEILSLELLTDFKYLCNFLRYKALNIFKHAVTSQFDVTVATKPSMEGLFWPQIRILGYEEPLYTSFH